jgi:hypothetical protein
MLRAELAESREPRAESQRGNALLATLGAMMLMGALGSALIVVSMTETRIAANYDAGAGALHAAEGVADLVVEELAVAPDWTPALAGLASSRLTDGAHGGTRTLPDGRTLDLAAATSLLRCGHSTACNDSDMNDATSERPWGANNPRWQLYAHGRLSELVPESGAAGPYVVAWVGDDASEEDGDPLSDGEPGSPGHGVVRIVAHAYGRDGTRRALEMTIERIDRTGPSRVRLVAWREVR